MADDVHDPDPLRRLADLLRERPGLLLDRWERIILRAHPAAPPALRAHMPEVVERLAAEIGRAGAAEEAEPWSPVWEDMCVPDDPAVALRELPLLRPALVELCAAEGVALEGHALFLVHDALGHAANAVAIAITRGAKAAAERERARLDLTLRLLPVGVFISDAAGRILTANDAGVRLWGANVRAESAADYGVYRAYRPGEREPVAASDWALARALRGEAPVDEDLEIVAFDGERRMIQNSALALCDPDGTITGGVAVNVDVTDRKRTELRFAALIEGALDAIVIVDAAGKVTEFNAAAERIFGYARAEAVGRELAELVIPPAQREAHRRGLRHYLATGESVIVGRRVELRAMRADGTLFDAELSVIPLPTGAPSFAGFVRDITDRRRAEEERAREAEFRERFIGMLGHDLRTPLSAIAFAAQNLLRRETLGPEDSRALARIVASAGRMERMIRDLLDFARARGGGGIPVTPEPADLCSICRYVLDEVALLHPDRAVELRCCAGAGGRWDPDRMAQVVQNLVLNALDYSPPDAPVEVAVDRAGEDVVLAVRNGGPPIPKELLPDLFDPFRRGAHAARGPGARGLGLGLYITHEIVRAHRGRVTVESDDVRGTTFLVELPRGPALAA
jgi:PAS domain S-box-containing protein